MPSSILTRVNLFDLNDKTTARTATMKLDLHTLVKRGLNWDVLPDELRSIYGYLTAI